MVIRADEGDHVEVHAFQLSPDETFVRLEIENPAYQDGGDCDWITLSADCARRLGSALLAAADSVDQVNAAVTA